VGATIRALTKQGVDVSVVSIFAGDPDATTSASYWDAARGETQGAAARQRRDEDGAALSELGAIATALPFADSGYVSARDPEAIWDLLAPAISPADLILLPGWPLGHADHRYATLLVLERVDATMPIVFYAEQPYASNPVTHVKGIVRNRSVAPLRHAYGSDILWTRQRVDRQCRDAQRRAVRHYAGELKNLGPRALMASLGRRVSGEWLGIGAKVPVPPGLGVLG
jgi:LmbE family N-acetylglucosaminyl deacetylase